MKKGLGRGLDALLGDYSAPAPEGTRSVDVYLIDTNSAQPRKSFDEDKLKELSVSIARHGVVQPIIVRESNGRFTIVAGERRYRAARLAGLAEVPVIIKNMQDAEVMEVALVENIQREDLNPIEEAAAIKFLMQQHDLTQEEVSERLAKSRPAIANALRLLNLPEAVQAYLREGKLQAGHARAILSVADAKLQVALADKIAAGGISVRQAESLAKALNEAKAAQPKKAHPAADPDIRAAEDALRTRLGTKVNIVGDQKKGRVVIEYYSRDDLNGIYELLTAEL